MRYIISFLLFSVSAFGQCGILVLNPVTFHLVCTGPASSFTTLIPTSPNSSITIGNTGTATPTLDVSTTYLNTLYPQLGASNLFGAGFKQTVQPSASTAGFRVAGGAIPTTNPHTAGDWMTDPAGRPVVGDGLNDQYLVTMAGVGITPPAAPTSGHLMKWGPGYTVVSTGTSIWPIANLATGTPNGTKFIRDDGTLQSIPGGGDALTANPLSQFAATTSAQLRGVLSDESGTGAALFAGGNIGAATGTSLGLSGGMSTGGSTDTSCNDGTAGCIVQQQGTAPSALPTTGIQEIAPTSITSYRRIRAGSASTSGFPFFTFASSPVTQMTESFVAPSGTGSVCLTISCAMTTPNLGTPSAAVLTNATGLPEGGLSTTDITSNNVSSTKHGFAPKSPADATQFLNGAATPAFAAVKDSDLSTTDVTTNNVSTSKHGFAPKAPNDATKYLDGTGSYTVPVGGGGGSAGANLFSTTNSTTVTATSATTLIGTVSGSTTVAVNTFTAGSSLQIVGQGFYTTPATPVSLTIDIKIGGSVRVTTGAVVQLASVTSGVWNLACEITTRTAGASGTQIANCIFVGTGSTLTPAEAPMFTSSTWTIDTTATQAIDVQATWSTATGSPTITSTNIAARIPGAPVTSVFGVTGAVGNLTGDVTSSGVATTIGAAKVAPSMMKASTFDAQADGATITWAIGSVKDANASVTLGGNRTLAITNPVIGGNYVLKLTQDGTGSRTLTLGSGCTWKVINGGAGAVTLSTAASSIDVLAFEYDGTNCLATLGKNYN